MIDFRVSGFDWDEGNRAKCQKHGLTVAHIEALFAGNPRIAHDPKHSDDEDRLIAGGQNEYGTASFRRVHDWVINNRRYIRPVTARYMHAKEVAVYEKESSTAENG